MSDGVELAILDMLEADARALWAVRVLDAWALAARERTYRVPGLQVALRWLVPEGGEWVETFAYHEGSTPDAARLAAAEAVWPELPEAERKRIGEKP